MDVIDFEEGPFEESSDGATARSTEVDVVSVHNIHILSHQTLRLHFNF